MRIGLSFDLKTGQPSKIGLPDDALEEFDCPATIDFITHALEAEGNTVVRLGGNREFLTHIIKEKIDLVFNIAEGHGAFRSREAQIPAVLEMLNIPYTGSDPQCLAISLDKPLTKKLALAECVLTPTWLVINDLQYMKNIPWREFPLPFIIKPAYEGSSKGIRNHALVHTPEEAEMTIRQQLSDYQQPVMLEEFIDGDEITVGIIGNPPHILGVMRILPRKKQRNFVYSLEVKRDWQNLVDYECPAKINKTASKRITMASLRVFHAIGCRDVARIDFRVRKGIPYFIEINPLPGLGDYSDLVIMAQKIGITHQNLIQSVFHAALERYPWYKHG